MKTYITSLVAKYDGIQRKIDLLSAKRDYLSSRSNSSRWEAEHLSMRYAKAAWPFEPHALLTMPPEASQLSTPNGILRKLEMDMESEAFDMWLAGENGRFISTDDITVESLIKANPDKVRELAPKAELDAQRQAWIEARERYLSLTRKQLAMDHVIKGLRKEMNAIGEELAPWVCPFRPNDIIVYDAEGGRAWVGSIKYAPDKFMGFGVGLFKVTAKGKGSKELYTNDNHMLLHLNPEIVKAHAAAMQKTWEMKKAPEMLAAA